MIGFLAWLSPGGQVGIEVPPGGMCRGCERSFVEGDGWVAIAELGENDRTKRTFEIHPGCFGRLKSRLESEG